MVGDKPIEHAHKTHAEAMTAMDALIEANFAWTVPLRLLLTAGWSLAESAARIAVTAITGPGQPR
jgi:hypothetical protein